MQLSTMYSSYKDMKNLDDCIKYLEERLKSYQTRKTDHQANPRVASQS